MKNADSLIAQIDNMIESSRQDIVDTTIKLININSELAPAEKGAPFGKGARQVLDTVLEMGEKEGFYNSEYGSGVISVALKEGTPDVGVWTHGDVVPAGTGWSFEPFNAVEHRGCVVGRGATDNKGQLAATFILLKIFKKLNIDLGYNPALYVGSHEEKGMRDILGLEGNKDAKGFINTCTPPKISLVPDGGFPVGYGGKGSINIRLKSKTPLRSFSITAGQPSTPGIATATFCGTNLPNALSECTVKKDADKTTVETFSPPRHGAHPSPDGNMITLLSNALLECGAVDESDKYILEFFKMISLDIDGITFGIKRDNNSMGPLTVFAHRIDMSDGYPELWVNIRYPIEISFDEVINSISEKAGEMGFEISFKQNLINPYLIDKNNPIIKKLTDIANEITGENKSPYTTNGATYAHVLPNAYVYGMAGGLRPADWPKTRGGAHGVDEVVSIDRLVRAMKIYARALIAISDLIWK